MKYNNYTLNDFLTSPTMSKLLSNTILGLFPQQLLFKTQSQINSFVSIGFSENFFGINTCIRVGIGYALHQEKMLDDFIRELIILEDFIKLFSIKTPSTLKLMI